MKSFVALCILAFIAVAAAVPHDRGCFYILGQCQFECPEGTHSYAPAANEKWKFEPTCDDPNPEQFNLYISDYSECQCDPPLVKESKTGKCLPLDECPKE